MNRDLLKRVGMLTAATAACTAGVFGALALNGLRYMRRRGKTFSDRKSQISKEVFASFFSECV